jgi:uncharacterized protein YndB with AHSA1/START domain
MSVMTESTDATREIASTRVFDAPRELVWRMWTEPEHIKHWWGPRGFTNTIYEMDVRPGGTWRFVMHGPDGTNYKNVIVYDEVVAPERLTYSHGPAPRFDVFVTFEEEGTKTRVRMRSVFESAEMRDRVVKVQGAIEGMNQTLDRLGEWLANRSAFAISRTFDAPRELMFRLWTERDHLQQWFGPKGMEIFSCTNDLRPGGMMHYGMRSPDGAEMWARWIYREIRPPERFVFMLSFSDPEGGLRRAPFEEQWPLQMLSTVTFAEVDGRTTVTVQSAAFEATEEERKVFDENHPSMQQGWSGTFEQLAGYLERV